MRKCVKETFTVFLISYFLVRVSTKKECVLQGSEGGVYKCTPTGNNQVAPTNCRNDDGHTCVVSDVRNDPQKSTILSYTLTITPIFYTKENILCILSTQSNTDGVVTEWKRISLPFVFDSDTEPDIVCNRAKIDKDNYETSYPCYIKLAKSTDTITFSNEPNLVISTKYFEKVQKSKYFTPKNVTIIVKEITVYVGNTYEFQIKIPDGSSKSTNKISHTISYTSSYVPSIECVNKDGNNRKIECIVTSLYKIFKILLETNSLRCPQTYDYVKNNDIGPTYQGKLTISLTCEGMYSYANDFNIEIRVYQTDTQRLSTQTKKFDYLLTLQEKSPKLSCNPYTVNSSPCKNIRFPCLLVTKNSEGTLKTNPSTFEISPKTIKMTQKEDVYIKFFYLEMYNTHQLHKNENLVEVIVTVGQTELKTTVEYPKSCENSEYRTLAVPHSLLKPDVQQEKINKDTPKSNLQGTDSKIKKEIKPGIDLKDPDGPKEHNDPKDSKNPINPKNPIDSSDTKNPKYSIGPKDGGSQKKSEEDPTKKARSSGKSIFYILPIVVISALGGIAFAMFFLNKKRSRSLKYNI